MSCVNTEGNTGFGPAQPVHRVQGIRFPGRDYRMPAFYLVTMTTFERKAMFSTCENGKSSLNPDGWLVYDLWHRMARDYPQIEISTLVIMPDHLHGIVRVKEWMEKPLGVPLRAFKSQVTSALRKRTGNMVLQVWTPGYHDWAVWNKGALSAYTRYVMDNPRRHCLKKVNPDLFERVSNLCHSRLPEEETWCGYGNLFLLDKPELRNLVVSRKASQDQLEEMRRDVCQAAQAGCVFISPIISPGEKELARFILDAGGSLIVMRPHGFDPFFKPIGKHFDMCLQGQLLFLSCRPPAPPSMPVTRDLCLAMNRWCARIACSA